MILIKLNTSMNIPESFLEWQKNLKTSLAMKGIKQSHVYKKIGMSRSTWSTRLKRFNFTAKEGIAIYNLLND